MKSKKGKNRNLCFKCGRSLGGDVVVFENRYYHHKCLLVLLERRKIKRRCINNFKKKLKVLVAGSF